MKPSIRCVVPGSQSSRGYVAPAIFIQWRRRIYRCKIVVWLIWSLWYGLALCICLFIFLYRLNGFLSLAYLIPNDLGLVLLGPGTLPVYGRLRPKVMSVSLAYTSQRYIGSFRYLWLWYTYRHLHPHDHCASCLNYWP